MLPMIRIYYFKLMRLAVISNPTFIFNHNKVIIQVSYFINRRIFFLNNNARSNLLYLMIFNNNSMVGLGRSNLLFNLNRMFDNTVGSYKNTYSGNHIKAIS